MREFRLLRVDLSTETIDSMHLDEQVMRKYIGGPGLASKILWEETDAHTVPLSDKNILIFTIGPLTGTVVPNSSRYTVVGLSPLTGIWGEAHGGGSWEHALSRTPYLGIMVAGRANKPLYLWVNGDKAELRDANFLWGKDTFQSHDLVKKDTDEQASVITIGQAGERLIKFASVMGDGMAARAAARSGLGAAMGYKNLKAIAVKGSTMSSVKNLEQLRESVKRYFPMVTYDPQKFKAKLWQAASKHADRNGCIKNWTLGKFDSFGKKWADESMKANPWYCPGCRTSSFSCLTYGKQRHMHGEFILPFGSNCLIDDMEALREANDLCNRYGVDCTSAGQVIAFTMELYDRGIINQEDTGGIKLVWGNALAMLQMLRNIVERVGMGEIAGEGVRAAAGQIGSSANEYAIHVKGLELPLYDPRCNNAYALQYATANRGADHLDGFVGLHGRHLSPNREAYATSYLVDEIAKKAVTDPFAIRGQGHLVTWAQNFDGLVECIGVCKFLAMPGWVREPDEQFLGIKPEQFLEWLNIATGWDLNLTEFMKAGERIFNLKRMINVRRGISRKDDMLPMRLLTRKRGGEGPQADNLPPLGAMLDEYYGCRGWSEEGVPTKERLTALNLYEI